MLINAQMYGYKAYCGEIIYKVCFITCKSSFYFIYLSLNSYGVKRKNSYDRKKIYVQIRKKAEN